jgi:hypothetical protein
MTMSMTSSSCLVPVWRGLSSSLVRRRGRLSTYVAVDGAGRRSDSSNGVLAGLRKEVRTCEYHDVHVMWEMLSGGGNQ